MNPDLAMQILATILQTYGTILGIVSSFYLFIFQYVAKSKPVNEIVENAFWAFFIFACVTIVQTLFFMLFLAYGILTGLALDLAMWIVTVFSIFILYLLGRVIHIFLKYFRLSKGMKEFPTK